MLLRNQNQALLENEIFHFNIVLKTKLAKKNFFNTLTRHIMEENLYNCSFIHLLNWPIMWQRHNT